MARRGRKTPVAGQIIQSIRGSRRDVQARRMLSAVFAIGLLATVAILRLVSIQVFSYKAYAKRARSIHTKRIVLPARRGEILDCRHKPLAVSRELLSLWGCSYGLKDSENQRAAKILKSVGWIPKEKVKAVFQNPPRFAWLRRFCEDEVVSWVCSLKPPGVGYTVENLRCYLCDWASNIIGFVNLQGEALEGVERRFDNILRGEPGLMEVDPYVRLLDSPLPKRVLKQPTNGKNVVLTIDSTIQYILFEELRSACKSWSATQALGLIMDPRTGAILAMATWPSYSSGDYKRYDHSLYRARCVTDLFEPGSLFKVFSLAGALDMGLVTPESVVFCENGRMRVGKSTISDWKAFGELEVQDVLAYSSSIGTAKVCMMLGPRLLREYLMRFGLLQKPGLGIFAEPAPGFRRHGVWDDEYLSFVSFGQGISVSALSLVSAISAIANDGILMRPYLLAAVEDDQGNVLRRTRPRMVRRVVSASTARTLTRMLVRSVEHGTGHNAAVPGVTVCGKTGTAQIFDRKQKAYSHDDLITSFIGFAPAEDAKIAVLISVFRPRHTQRETWGSTVAAPVFSAVVKHVLAYLRAGKPRLLQTAERTQKTRETRS